MLSGIGCSKKSSPEDIALAYTNFYLKDEVSEVLPLNSDEVKNILQDNKVKFTKNLNESYGEELPKDKIDIIYKKSLELAKNIESIKSEKVSETDAECVIKLTSRPLARHAYTSQNDIKRSKFTEEELQDINTQIKLHIDWLDDINFFPKFSDDEISIEITLKKENDRWVISESDIDEVQKLVITEDAEVFYNE